MFKMLVYGAVCLASVLPVSASADNSLYLNSSPSVLGGRCANARTMLPPVYRVQFISGKKAVYRESLSIISSGGTSSVVNMHTVRSYDGHRLNKPLSVGVSIHMYAQNDGTHVHINITWHSLRLTQQRYYTGMFSYRTYGAEHITTHFSGVLNLKMGQSVYLYAAKRDSHPNYVIITRLQN